MSSIENPQQLKELLEKNRNLALSYWHAYQKRTVQDGETYDGWVFAENATYWSPYFGDNVINLRANPISVKDSATMEALAYSVEFPDWGPLGFKCWPSDRGVAMQTHFGGHTRAGKFMDFYAYGFIETDESGVITHWETHVSPEYSDFLDVAIGTHGPFKNGPEPYMQAVAAKLRQAGVTLPR